MYNDSRFRSNAAQQAYEANGCTVTWEVEFLEWFETPLNYETNRQRHEREEREHLQATKLHLKPMGPVEQKIGLAFLGCMVVGMIVLGIYF